MSEHIDPPGAESAGAGPGDAGLSVDERFARLAAEIDGSTVTGRGAKEESARTRSLRAQWSANPPKPVAWRADGPSGPAPAGPADAAPKKRRKRIRVHPLLIVIAIVAGLVAVDKLASKPAAPLAPNSSPAGTAAPWGDAGTPTASPSPSPSFSNMDDAYFVGSPALDWADNEAGFVIPAAKALNGVGKSDVAAGYRLLYKVMAAGNLDATILEGGSTADFSKLLDPKNPVSARLAEDLAHPSYQDDPTDLVTRFDPKATGLLGHTVKVRGTMSESPGAKQGTVYLTANYLFVYAVAPASGDAADHQRVVVHRTVELEVVDPARGYQVTQGKAWLRDYTVQFANDQCYDYNGYVNPQFTDNGAVPNETGSLDPYATGNLLSEASAAPSPTSTGPGCMAGGTT